MKWYFQACPVCSGDLHDDLEDRGWATCFMCARSFPVADVQPTQYAEAKRSVALGEEQLAAAA